MKQRKLETYLGTEIQCDADHSLHSEIGVHKITRYGENEYSFRPNSTGKNDNIIQ